MKNFLQKFMPGDLSSSAYSLLQHKTDNPAQFDLIFCSFRRRQHVMRDNLTKA